MLETLLSVLPVLLLFVLGFVLRQFSFFSKDSIADVRKIVTHLALPAMLFGAFSSIEIEASYLILVVLVFASCLGMVFIGKVLAKPLKISSPYFPIMMGGFEMGMLGYALFITIYGQRHMGKVALVDLGQVLFVFFVLVALLIKKRDGVQNIGILLKRFVTSPVILAILAGIGASLLKPHMDIGPELEAVGEFISLLGSLTVPLIALTIGYGITIKLDGILDSLKTIIVRKIVALAFVLVLNLLVVDLLLEMDSMYRYAMMVMFLTPSPFIIALFMKTGDKKNSDYVSNTLSLDTLVSIVLVVLVSSVYV